MAESGARTARRWPDPLDIHLLRKSLADLAPVADQVMSYFFARLFVGHPEIRAMFPLAMDDQRQRVFAALTRCVWDAADPPSLAARLGRLADGHRTYGVAARHYHVFCAELLAALRAWGAGRWGPETDAAWEAALSHIAAVLADAASSDRPAWWVGEVVAHERRSADIAALTVHVPGGSLRHRPGQHVHLQTPHWPRVWRPYSIASAPRADGTFDLHVRAIAGGMVSTALVHRTRPGDSLVLGPARGEMTAGAASGGDILCVAGGTGLAPIKAIVEGVIAAARPGRRPAVRLLVGARRESDLYDQVDLSRLAARYPLLTVLPVISDQPEYPGLRGALPEIVHQHVPDPPGDVFISGPDAMIAQTARAVSRVSPETRVHLDVPDVPDSGLSAFR